MKVIRLNDMNLLDFGNSIGLVGNIWAGNDGVSYITLFPEFNLEDLGEIQAIEMDLDDWKKMIRQSDILETQILQNDDGKLKKVTVRKSARLIDNRMQWAVFKRDNYCCRYCGKSGIPLSVDHIDLWEDGGATVEENLLTACRKCNKTRGNTPYEVWINTAKYNSINKDLPSEIKEANLAIVAQLPHLQSIRVTNIRSR